MRQSFCILRKDFGRLWIETVISMVALGLLTRTEWQLSTAARNPRWYSQVLPVVAVFLSWWFLVVRLIQGEALVGERRFWVTRPYIWYKLLAAKALFIVAFVALPLVLSQMALVVLARGPLLANIGGVILGTGGAMLAGILPVAACAVMTRDLPRWLMCAVLLILLLIGMVWLDTVTPDSHVSTGWDSAENVQAVVFAGLALSGIVLRYARRHSRWGGVAIVAGFVALPVAQVAVPYRAIIAARFPMLEENQLLFRARYVPKAGPITDGGVGADRRIRVCVPMQIVATREDPLLTLNGVMLSADLPDGKRYESEWQPAYHSPLTGGEPFVVDLEIDRSVVERAKETAVPARLSVAVSEMEDRGRQRIVARRAFEAPGVGSCWIDGFSGVLECRSTNGGPLMVMVTVRESEWTCEPDSNARDRVIRSLNSNSGDGPLSPLILRSFDVGRVCPGTPLQFSTPVVVRRFRFEVPLGVVDLRRYVSSGLLL